MDVTKTTCFFLLLVISSSVIGQSPPNTGFVQDPNIPPMDPNTPSGTSPLLSLDPVAMLNQAMSPQPNQASSSDLLNNQPLASNFASPLSNPSLISDLASSNTASSPLQQLQQQQQQQQQQQPGGTTTPLQSSLLSLASLENNGVAGLLLPRMLNLNPKNSFVYATQGMEEMVNNMMVDRMGKAMARNNPSLSGSPLAGLLAGQMMDLNVPDGYMANSFLFSGNNPWNMVNMMRLGNSAL